MSVTLHSLILRGDAFRLARVGAVPSEARTAATDSFSRQALSPLSINRSEIFQNNSEIFQNRSEIFLDISKSIEIRADNVTVSTDGTLFADNIVEHPSHELDKTP